MERLPKHIDLASWPRRDHYAFFRQYRLPFFSITNPVDVAPLRKALKERNTSFTVGLIYVIARAANSVPEFRQRIREDGPIEHESVDPGLTILCEGDVFRFGFLRYDENFDRFADEAVQSIEITRKAEMLLPKSFQEAPRDDLLYCTALPWFSFSGMFHPLALDPMDSVPRIAWGRFEEKEGKLLMPLNVQAHHALIDGIHIAKFMDKTEELIRKCAAFL